MANLSDHPLDVVIVLEIGQWPDAILIILKLQILKHAQEMHRDEPVRKRRERLSASGSDYDDTDSMDCGHQTVCPDSIMCVHE